MAKQRWFVTCAEVAERMGVTESTVRSWLNNGYIPYVRFGKKRAIPRTQFNQWIRKLGVEETDNGELAETTC